MKVSYVYIVTNKNNTVLYTGVTSNITDRIYKHKQKFYKKSFTARYNCDKLVYYKVFFDIREAIAYEKKIKGGNRKNKIKLITERNPGWLDLSEEWYK